jgi:outer membrane autotransporter protein
MTVSNRNKSAKLSRIARSIKPTKTAAAVRAGLLATTAILSLAGSGMAFAQSCVTAANVTTCSGDFTDSVNNHFADANDLTVILDSTVTVDAGTGNVGIDASWTGDMTLVSYGTFTADEADAIYAYGSESATVGVYGDIYVYASSADDNAVHVYSPGDVSLVIDSALSTYGYNADAYTVEAFSDAGDVTIDVQGYGSVDATSYNGNALAVWSEADFGDVSLTNSGAISATTTYGDYAWGAYIYSYYDSSVDNSGSISATAYDNAYGVHLWALYGDVDVTNSGEISAVATSYYDQTQAIGVYAYSWDGYTTVENTNSITAQAGTSLYESGAFATGVYAYGYAGSSVDNSGDIDASIYANSGTAFGVHAISYNTAEVYNTGSISASSTGYYGAAFGVYAYGYDASVVNYGDDASIYAYANYGSAVGVVAYGFNSAVVDNSGDISAVAAYYGTAAGVLATGYYATVNNSGSISAYAGGYYDVDAAVYAPGLAAGVVVSGFYATVNNSGDIYGGTSYGTAYGAYAYGGYSYINNNDGGSIDAYAYYGTAIGAASFGIYEGYVYNDADISASAHYGTAIAVYAASAYDADVVNTGNGSIYAYAYYGSAIGVNVASGGDASVVNYGDITAYGVIGFAAGIYADVDDYLSIYNAGSIGAYNYPGYGVAYSIMSVGYSSDTVVNEGDITGSIYLGYGTDYLYNNAAGTINLGDGQFIDMGTYGLAGPNIVQNYGTITFSGSTGIYNYGGYVYNAGVLDSFNGAAGDYLFIGSDFDGDGTFNLEVDGAAAAQPVADYVYIYGNVAADSNTLLNVDLMSLPHSDSTVTPLVGVSGDSTGANFDLEVNYQDNNFLDLDITLIEDIDPTNATPDVFSLGIEVVGLTDPGTLAASVVGSNISLLNTTVGTWRQRMGVIDSFRKNAVGLWARVFTSKGDFSPEHVATGFGQGGNFDWHQRNSGFEAGIDFAVTDALSLGVLVGKSEADVDLIDGFGENEIDSDNYGVYATWVRDGWYIDASYRWADIENRLRSVGGDMRMDSDAEIFNIEAGYAFVMASGLKVEPQVQYTSTKFDHFDVALGDLANFTVNDADSSRGRVGLSFRQDFGDAETGWMWTPYATLSAVREFEGDGNYLITDDFYGYNSVEGTSAMLELGFNARHDNLAFYGGLTWQDGGPMQSMFGGHLGIRYTFGGAAPVVVETVVPPPAKTCADLDDDGDGVNNCDDKCAGSTAGMAVGADGCPVPAPEPEPVMEPKPYRG